MMNKSTIESRIASMLSAADAKSDAIAALITEVEVAAQEADATATKTREKALDPATVIDAAKVGAAVATAELTRDRLRAALPRLQQRLNQAREREYTAAWREDFERVEAKRDALAAEYAETYPQVVERLVDLLHRVEACDREVSHVNQMAPSGARAHLCEVELTARGVERLLQPDIEIAKELRLPNFKRAANQPLFAWPPPQPSLAASLRVPAGPGPDWHAATEERDRRRREEAELREAREARWRRR